MVRTPWGQTGYITYKRTYSRRLKEDNVNSATEEFPDTVDRVIKACSKQLKVGFTPEEEADVRNMMLGLEGTVAGRFMWQLGTRTVDNLGLASLQNCASTVVDHPVRPFTWAMDMLMLGSGVGYNIQREYVYKLPKPKKIKITRLDTKDADFIVPDTRQGWVELLHKTLEAHFITGKGFSYSTVCIRGKGTPIKGFGGLASGPEDLCWGIGEIHKLLNSRANKQVRPIDALDIMNIIGAIVVSGNVRRSAQLAMGDFDDLQFLAAKRWDLGNIPSWRAMSNNSVVCNDFSKLPDQFWEGYNGNGEPYGLINLKLAQSIGRVGDYSRPDPKLICFNPCQPEFATVMTPEGVKQFKDIKEGSVIWSKEGWTTVVKKWSTGVKPVYEYVATGGKFVGTENHRLDTSDGKVEAKDATDVMAIAGPQIDTTSFIPEAVMDGLFLGDGYHKLMDGRDYTYSVLCIGDNDSDYFSSEVSHLINSKMDSRGFRVQTSITVSEVPRMNLRVIPDRYFMKSSDVTASFLRGLYSANGSVIRQAGNSVRITLKSTSKTLCEQVQQMLSTLGIRSYITTNLSSNVQFNNGEYTCKESYDLNITKDTLEFYKLVGFLQNYKMDKIRAIVDTYKPSNKPMYSSVKEVKYLGEFEVFDITVDNPSHTYWTGGLSVSNCVEQGLANFETCCLAEVFLPNIKTKDRLLTVLKYLYRICKHSLALDCHHPETESIVHEHMRMGIGVTGYLQATEEQRLWLSDAYAELRKYDSDYSKQQGFNESIKLTTCKPSGTLSLLAGVTPGAHPAYAQYYIRRIRMASNIPLVDECRKNGYDIEFQRNFDGSEDRGTVVVSFPVAHPEGTILAAQMTAIDQLEVVKRLQTEWSDNGVSVTVYYRKEELDSIKAWLAQNYNQNLKAVSFLLHSEHGFDQAPMEEITKEQYEAMVARVIPIQSMSVIEGVDDNAECASGVCPIK